MLGSAAAGQRPFNPFSPSREDIADDRLHERLALVLQHHIQTEVIWVPKHRQQLFVIVPKHHKFLSETLRHIAAGVRIGVEPDTVQFERVVKIEFVFGHK
jgi:hypothetical protein